MANLIRASLRYAFQSYHKILICRNSVFSIQICNYSAFSKTTHQDLDSINDREAQIRIARHSRNCIFQSMEKLSSVDCLSKWSIFHDRDPYHFVMNMKILTRSEIRDPLVYRKLLKILFLYSQKVMQCDSEREWNLDCEIKKMVKRYASSIHFSIDLDLEYIGYDSDPNGDMYHMRSTILRAIEKSTENTKTMNNAQCDFIAMNTLYIRLL